MAASFPTSVKSFTTKTAGGGIGSDHVNDLQLEVTAIETELKKTTGSVVDHGGLAGLADNDHPQYLIAASGVAADSTKVANTTPSVAGKNMLSAATILAQKDLLGLKLTALAGLNDDTAANLTPINPSGFLFLRRLGTTFAIISFDAVAGTAYCTLMIGSADMAVTTGVLAGTTGTDGKLTVSAHTDGKIYIGNRLGTTIYLGYIAL